MDLTCSHVTVARGGLAILAGVSFQLRSGQALVLRGANGLGKTTLLRTIAGLQPAMSGAITPGPDQITYAAHADAVKSALSVRENLEFWAAIYGSSKLDLALRDMDLETLQDRRAQTLSAGQRRRLGLARLLLSDRPIWVLDEPTVSLDAANVALFARHIARHLAQGGSALMASHIDPGVAGATALDLAPYRASGSQTTASGTAAGFDEAFL